MKQIAQILKNKPEQKVHTVAPGDSVHEAARRMMENRVGALLVMDGGEVVGIVSERDCAWKIVGAGRSAVGSVVRDIMSSPVQYVPPTHTNEDCMALMTDKRLRHLPVMDQGRLVGLVSIGDLVKDIISEQSFIIQQLEHYISGDRG